MVVARLTIALFLIAGCASLGVESEFSAGRQALLRGEPDNALAYFERVAQSDSGFVTNSVSPRRGVWTYIGRAHYNSGRYAQAQLAFEKAVGQMADDYIAKLYLSLTRLRPSPAPAPPKAFSLQEVTFALREGVEPKRVAALASERGVAFDLSKETESQLQTVGADSFLLNELKKIRAQNVKQNPTSNVQREQASKELAAALTGLREWLDYTVTSTPEGVFWDPSGQIRNQLQLCLKLLSARPPDWDRLIANSEWAGSMLEEESDRARRDEAAERNRQLRR